MRSLSTIKRKIKTINSIRKVTKATAAIASIRLQALLSPLEVLAQYHETLEASAGDIARHTDRQLLESSVPFFRKGKTTKVLFIIFTSDKGLCGVYNNKLLSEVAEASRNQIRQGRKLSFVSFGRHACEYLSRMNRSIARVYPASSFAGAETAAKELAQLCSSKFISKDIDEVRVFYNRFLSAGLRKAGTSVFLPLNVEAIPDATGDFEFDDAAGGFLLSFFSHYLETTLRRAMLESAASEQSARMSAMQESASNADDLIRGLSMKYNRIRQARITGELIEVVSSAEALN